MERSCRDQRRVALFDANVGVGSAKSAELADDPEYDKHCGVTFEMTRAQQAVELSTPDKMHPSCMGASMGMEALIKEGKVVDDAKTMLAKVNAACGYEALIRFCTGQPQPAASRTPLKPCRGVQAFRRRRSSRRSVTPASPSDYCRVGRPVAQPRATDMMSSIAARILPRRSRSASASPRTRSSALLNVDSCRERTSSSASASSRHR